MASKVSAVVSAWKSFDFLGLQKDLDSEAIALAQRQDESETSRRRLVEQSREFKRSISEEIRVAVAPLLKSFQNEVDSLNKRSKAAEMAFLAVYKHLGDVTDPLPWLEMIPSLQQKVSKVQDLEAERKQLKETLAEYEEEFSQVCNQDVTIKQLREKLRQAEENTDEAVEARLADFQTQFRKEFAERERELTELQKLTERKLMETESRVTSMQMLVNELQSELFDTRSRLDEAAHAKSKEVELLLSDLERANQRAALAEKEVSAFQEQLQQVSTGQRQGATTAPGQLVTQGRGHNQERDVHTPPAANMDTPLDMLARPSLQLELAAKEKEVQSLLEDIQRLQTSLAQLRESSARQLSLLEEQLEARARHIQRLEAQLEEQKNYQEMKRELSILKSIEFPGLAGMESSPGKPLEVLLLERSKALQSENASLKLNNADMQGSLRKPGNVSPPPASSSALPQAAPTSSSSSSGIRSSPWSTSTTTAAPNLPPGVTSPLPHFSSMPRGFPPVFHPSLGPFGSLLTDDVMLSWRRSLEASMINQHQQQQHAQQLSHSHQQQQSQSRSPERDSRRSPTPRSCVPTSHGADNSNSVEQQHRERERERERDTSPDAAAASPRHRARSAEESRERERDSRPDDNEQHPPAGLNCHNPVNHSATSSASSAAAEAAAAVAAQNNHHSHHPHYPNHPNQAGLSLSISKNSSEPNHGAPYANPRLLPSHQHPWPWDYRLEDMPLPLQNLLARSAAAAAAAEDQMTPMNSLPEGLTSLLAKSNPLEARLQEMLRATMERYSTHALDTLAISRGVRELLSLHNIGQRLFAKFVLGLSQGTVSELLSKPKPWDKLTEKGRDSYRKMHAWACDEAAILLLKSLIPRKGKEAGLGTPSRNEENVATEERIAHILSEATASLRQQPINEDQQSDDSKPPSQAQTPSPGPRPDGISNGNLTEAQRRLRKYENDDISQEQVMRIYQEELAKLMGVSFGNPAAAAAMANFNFGHLPRSFAQHYQRLAASSMFDRSPEEIRMALDVYQQELSRLIPPSAFPHHGNAAQGSGNLPPPTLPNGTVQDLSLPKSKAEEEALKSSNSKEERDNMDKCEDNKSPGNPARVKTETGVSTPGPNATPSPYPLSMPSPMSSHQPTQSILYPGMSPSPEDSVGMGGGVASPLQRMASITNSLMSQPAHPNTPSSAQRPMKPVLPPITQQQFDAYQNLNTEDIVKRVKEQLSQYSISQRLFGESVLGLSQGSVSDLLARPKPWHMLTQKGREPFIRMKLFLEDENAVHKLVASQYKIAPEKLMRTGGYANSPQIGGGKNPKLGSPQDMSLFHGHRPHLHNAMDFHPLNAGTSPVPHLSPGLPFPHLGQMPFPGAMGLNFPPVSMASRLPSLSPLSRMKSEKEDIKAGGGKSGGGGAAAAAALASAASSPSANTGGAGGGFGQQHTPTREHFALDNHGEGSPMPNLPFPCEYPAHSVYEMAALTQDLDTQLTTTRIKEVLLANNIGQKIFGEAVLGLSQGSVSELLSKPKPWHMLSIKGREPFIRMQLWLSDARNIEKLQRLKNQRREAGKRRRETLDGSSNPNAPTQSAETSSNDSQDNNDSVSATKKQRVLFSEPQKEALKLAYTLDPYPSTSTIEFLSNELGLSTRTITNWFHNHRMRLKQQTGNQNTASESSPLLASLEQLQQQSGGDLNGREGQWDPMKFRLLLNQRLLELEAVEGNFPLGGFPPGFPAGLTYHPFYATGMLSQFCMGLTAEQANNPHSGLDLTINKDFDGDRDADADADVEMNEGDQEHEAGSSEYDSGLSTPSPRPAPHCESSASPAMANVHRNRPELLRPELTVERSSRRSRKPAAPQWVNPQWQEPEEDKEDNGDKKEEILINGVCVLQTSEDNNNGKVAVVAEPAIRSEDVEDSPEPSSSVKPEPVESNEDL